MKAPSLRLRLTLWYTSSLIVALCLFGAEVLWGQGRVGLRRVDRELDSLSSSLADAMQGASTGHVELALAAEEARRTVSLPGSAVAILDGHGRTLSANWNGLPPIAALPAVDRGRVAWTTDTASGAWRVHAAPLAFEPASAVIIVAQSLVDVRREQHEVLEAMQVAIPLALLLAGGGGFWLASVGLRPITQMAQRASDISPTGMDELGHTERTDELGQLARAFNGLVARLRSALRTQRQFMADASHELRTPVSVMRAAAEVALRREGREESDYRETLAIVGDEARRLSRLVDNMLVLARADAGGVQLRPVDLYLDDVLSDCCRVLQPLSAERQVAIRPGDWPEVPLKADEDLLRQMILNVLQNAVQHTPAGGNVSISLTHGDGRIELRITDTGPGVPAADRGRIFDRFVQLDHARRGSGSGLGLPIARWIADAHGGTLALESSGPGGSTFCITLPG